jgi:hypothetical protein
MCRTLQTLLIVAALAAAAPSQAQVTYNFHSDIDDSFVIVAPGLITADITFANPSTCLVIGQLPCLQVDFFIDAFEHQLSPDYGWQAIAVTGENRVAYYYFEGGTFESLGLHETTGPGGASLATLAVGVPEISPAQAMAIGLPVLAFLIRRRIRQPEPARTSTA